MAKKIIILFYFLLIYSCKNIDNKDVIKTIDKEYKDEENKVLIKKNTDTSNILTVDCLKIITDLIKKSNIENPFKNNLKIEIEEKNSINMKLRLFDANEKSEITIGWVTFDAENMRLLDITNDIQNPIILKFDNKLWNKIIECSFDNDKSYYIEEDEIKSKKENCKTISKDMETIEECIFDNSTIVDVYNKLIFEEELENSEYLLKSIPETDQKLNVNKKGLLNIEYKISIKKIEVIFNYEGGVTILDIEQIKNNVKRKIIHSAD
jgi:hypothetical protein